MTIQAAVEASTKKTRAATPEEGARAGSVVQRAVEADPVLMNAMSQEKWFQSGVMWGGATGILSSLGIILTQMGTHGLALHEYDYATTTGAILALASAIGVIYRRFAPGLRPLFWRWTRPGA